MVEAGVSGVSPDKYKFRPVQLAAQNGHTEVVRWLEEQGYTWPPPELEEDPPPGPCATAQSEKITAAAKTVATEHQISTWNCAG